jgi:hypothetical protein
MDMFSRHNAGYDLDAQFFAHPPEMAGQDRNGSSNLMTLASLDLRMLATVAIFLATYAGVGSAVCRLGARSVLALPARPAGLEIGNNTKVRGTVRIRARSSRSDHH